MQIMRDSGEKRETLRNKNRREHLSYSSNGIRLIVNERSDCCSIQRSDQRLRVP